MSTRRKMPETLLKKTMKEKKTPLRSKSYEGQAKSTNIAAVHRRMTVAEILMLLPESQSVLAAYGLHCFGCAFNASETLEDGYLSHGYPEEELEALVRDLNALLRSHPKRPAVLTITRAGALALKQ